MNNGIARQDAVAAASGGRSGNDANRKCTLAPIKVNTPANCQKLSCLKTISGSGEPGQEITITIDCGPEFCDSTNGAGQFRVCSPEPLCPGFHTITVSYSCAPECPGDSVWVYVSEPVVLPPPVIACPVNGSVIDDDMPVITGFAAPGNLVTVSDQSGNSVNAFAGRGGEWAAQFPAPFAQGAQALFATQQESECSVSETGYTYFTVASAMPVSGQVWEPQGQTF